MHIILRACFGATKVNSAVYLPEFLSRLSSPSSVEDGETALCDTVQFYRVGTSLESRVQIIF